LEEIKSYIESGILELYVMGDLSAEERLEVEAMALKHFEIRDELKDIEASIENYAFENAIEPSEKLRNRVLNSLVTNLGDDRNFSSKPSLQHAAEVVAFPPPKPHNVYKYAFAACLALLLASLAALISVYNRLEDSTTQLIALQSEKQQFTKQVSSLDEQLAVFRDPSYQLIKLRGTPKTPASTLVVAYNPVKKKVMIDMANVKLPANDKNHQYQLWAIVGGKPVDLGMFDAAAADSTDMKTMKPVTDAQAFAVTLEPRGGSVNPTMDEMVVIAKI
jgi:anti-sigma-K factor RskA